MISSQISLGEKTFRSRFHDLKTQISLGEKTWRSRFHDLKTQISLGEDLEMDDEIEDEGPIEGIQSFEDLSDGKSQTSQICMLLLAAQYYFSGVVEGVA